MYVVFFGSDRGRVRDAVTEYVGTCLPESAQLTTLEAGSYETGQLKDALGATSLFGGEEWFILDTPSDNKDFTTDTKDSLKEMSESPNTFIIIEGSLLAPVKKSFGKYAEKIEEFTTKKTERFNTFAMADALASKDKRKLWMLLQEAKLNGLAAEEIIGILWWQLKTLRLASLTNSAAEAGLKDFPYNKAKRSLQHFSKDDVERLSQSLLELYHDGHAGVKDIDLALEKWVLTI